MDINPQKNAWRKKDSPAGQGSLELYAAEKPVPSENEWGKKESDLMDAAAENASLPPRVGKNQPISRSRTYISSFS